jgi:hypothetical protein
MAERAPILILSTVRYCGVVLVTLLGLIAFKEAGARAAELTCWPGGYQQDAWMAYCNSERYGVYDVEAIWHHVEPDVALVLQDAKIVSLTDSHLQNALSLGGASQWFAERHYPTYMLGLPTEESGFGERLLDNFHMHPSVVILDASPYFTGDVGASERGIFADPVGSRRQVTDLSEYQGWHRRACDRFPWACGHNFAYFRSRTDGHWIFPEPSKRIWIGRQDVPNDDRHYPVSERPNEREALYPQYLAVARELVAKLGIPAQCVVLTQVPSEEDLTGLARYIGGPLGITVIDPAVANLSTFDRSHLTPESSVRWTHQFLTELEPLLARCIPGKSTSPTE